MSLDNYFRLLRSNQHKRLINPIKRIDANSDSEKDNQNNSQQKFSDVMNEFLEEDQEEDMS